MAAAQPHPAAADDLPPVLECEVGRQQSWHANQDRAELFDWHEERKKSQYLPAAHNVFVVLRGWTSTADTLVKAVNGLFEVDMNGQSTRVISCQRVRRASMFRLVLADQYTFQVVQQACEKGPLDATPAQQKFRKCSMMEDKYKEQRVSEPIAVRRFALSSCSIGADVQMTDDSEQWSCLQLAEFDGGTIDIAYPQRTIVVRAERFLSLHVQILEWPWHQCIVFGAEVPAVNDAHGQTFVFHMHSPPTVRYNVGMGQTSQSVDVEEPHHNWLGRTRVLRVSLHKDGARALVRAVKPFSGDSSQYLFLGPQFIPEEQNKLLQTLVDRAPLATCGVSPPSCPAILPSFAAEYELLCLLSNRYIQIACRSKMELLRLLVYCSEDRKQRETLLERLTLELDKPAAPHGADPPPGTALIRRVMVSPVHIECRTAEPVTMCSILRKYVQYLDRFLLVGFAAAHGGPACVRDGDLSVKAYFRKVLLQGLWISSRHYKFVGYSNSQLREHHVWMYWEPTDDNPDSAPSVTDIYEWAGDWKSQDVPVEPQKLACRFGQCFTTTLVSLPTASLRVHPVKDIERNAHNFSDGIGLCSESVRDSLIELLMARSRTFAKRPSLPCAFQIRLGGHKGMLVVDPCLPSDTIQLRPSMCKFQGRDLGLGIAGFSQRLLFYLNQPLVAALEALGIAKDMFMDLFKENEACVLSAFDGCREAMAALCTFRHHTRGSRHYVLYQLLSSGCDPRHDAFLFGALSTWMIQRLAELYNRKARVHVPLAMAAYGVLDERGILKEDEVYLKLSSSPRPSHGQRVLVGRSPVAHLGDVRVCTVVTECPELEHLHDVVVFPQTGDRPLCHKMGFGDLDGDIYFVIWDRRLLPKAVQPPLTKEEVKLVSTGVRPPSSSSMAEGMADHFINFLVNDCVGLIASAWLRHGHTRGGSLRSDKCVQLSRMNSAALDFAKSGVPVNFDHRTFSLARSSWPDFQGGGYRSPSALGELYRAGGPQRLLAVSKHLHSSQRTPGIAVDRRLAPVLLRMSRQVGWDHKLEAARLLRDEYNRKVMEVMVHYELTEEAQFVLRELPSNAKRRLGRHAFRKQRERLRVACRAVEQKYLEVLAAAKNGDEVACVWYFVCYADEQYLRRWNTNVNSKRPAKTPMLSFAWLAAEPLCALLAELNLGGNAELNVSSVCD